MKTREKSRFKQNTSQKLNHFTIRVLTEFDL